MTNAEMHDSLFDNLLRFDQMLCLASVLAHPEDPLSHFSDFVADISFGDINPPAGLECLKVEGLDDESATELLFHHRKFGFLVHVHTPVPSFHGETCSFSFGYCRTGWFYGETLDAIIEQAVTWKDAIHEQAKESRA